MVTEEERKEYSGVIMKQSMKAMYIVGSCIILVLLFSLYILYRTIRPTPGLPYESVDMHRAAEYMQFETGYLLVDVSEASVYEREHIPDAINIPEADLVGSAAVELPDPDQMIYVYSDDTVGSRKAALSLCSLGYTNITQIEGNTQDYWKAAKELETDEGFFQRIRMGRAS